MTKQQAKALIVRDLMSRDIVTCHLGTSLADVARSMWERDCGFLPVMDRQDGALCGVITDRDVCMAAMTQGKPLADITVSSVAPSIVHTCLETDPVADAHHLMRAHQVRRLPVVDAKERLVGILSLNDLACAACGSDDKSRQDVAKTLAEICRHRAEAVA